MAVAEVRSDLVLLGWGLERSGLCLCSHPVMTDLVMLRDEERATYLLLEGEKDLEIQNEVGDEEEETDGIGNLSLASAVSREDGEGVTSVAE